MRSLMLMMKKWIKRWSPWRWWCCFWWWWWWLLWFCDANDFGNEHVGDQHDSDCDDDDVVDDDDDDYDDDVDDDDAAADNDDDDNDDDDGGCGGGDVVVVDDCDHDDADKDVDGGDDHGNDNLWWNCLVMRMVLVMSVLVMSMIVTFMVMLLMMMMITMMTMAMMTWKMIIRHDPDPEPWWRCKWYKSRGCKRCKFGGCKPYSDCRWNNCFLRASGPQFLVLHATQTDNTLISLHNNCHRWSSKSWVPDAALQLTCHRDLAALRPSHHSPNAVSLSRPPLVVTVLPIRTCHSWKHIWNILNQLSTQFWNFPCFTLWSSLWVFAMPSNAKPFCLMELLFQCLDALLLHLGLKPQQELNRQTILW